MRSAATSRGQLGNATNDNIDKRHDIQLQSRSVASVTLTFRHSEQGRRVSGTCVASTHGNAGKPKCTRVVAAGSLRLRADAGANKLRFEGRISPSRKLGPGRYTVLFAATSAAGKSSPPQSRSFTIAAP